MDRIEAGPKNYLENDEKSRFINVRLNRAKIFLCDEDVYRCLDFHQRLNEIIEYIRDISVGDAPYDKELLNDVKVMCKVHWDSLKTKEENDWLDVHPIQRPTISSTSRRLIAPDAIKAAQFERRLEQITDNDSRLFPAPSREEPEFYVALEEDASAWRDRVYTNTNLSELERRAYELAKNNPSIIPIQMLSKNIAPTARVLAPFREHFAQRRSHMMLEYFSIEVPDYLIEIEKIINDNLAALSNSERGKSRKDVIAWLAPFEPKQVVEHKTAYLTTTAMVAARVLDTIGSTRNDYRDKQIEWYSSFRRTGIKISVSRDATRIMEMEPPGHFSVPLWEPTPDQSHKLSIYENEINRIIQKYYSEELDESGEFSAVIQAPLNHQLIMNTLLIAILPGVAQNIQNSLLNFLEKAQVTTKKDLSLADAKQFDFLEKTLENEVRGLQVKFLEIGLAKRRAHIVILRPGEIRRDVKDVFYLPYDSKMFEEDLLPPEVRELERDINHLLRKSASEEEGLTKDELYQLYELLRSCMFPTLMLYESRILALEQQSLTHQLATEEKQELSQLDQLVGGYWIGWTKSFTYTGVRLRIGGMERVDPGNIYIQKLPRGASPSDLCAQAKKALSSGSKGRALEDALYYFMYPALRELVDQIRAWEKVTKDLNVKQPKTENEMYDAMVQKKRLFDSWVQWLSMDAIRFLPQPDGQDYSNDPSILYYRGLPLESDTNSDERVPSDGMLIKIQNEIQKDQLAGQKLPSKISTAWFYMPSHLKRHLASLDNAAGNGKLAEKNKERFISNYEFWAARVYQMAAFKSSGQAKTQRVSDGRITIDVLKREDEINALLKSLFAQGGDLSLLDEDTISMLQTLLHPFLPGELVELARTAQNEMDVQKYHHKYNSWVGTLAQGVRVITQKSELGDIPGLLKLRQPLEIRSTYLYMNWDRPRKRPSAPRQETSKQVEARKQVEAQINNLLRRRSDRTATNSEEEQLHHILGPSMPPALQKLDKDLSELDTLSRKSALDPQDCVRLNDLWRIWKLEYSAWLTIFVLPKVKLVAPKEHSDALPPRGTLYHYPERMTTRFPKPRLNLLPVHIQSKQNQVNRALRRPEGRTNKETKLLEAVLRPLWKDAASVLRIAALQGMGNSLSPGVFASDEKIVIKSRLDLFFGVFEASVRWSGVHIKEPSPGTFRAEIQASGLNDNSVRSANDKSHYAVAVYDDTSLELASRIPPALHFAERQFQTLYRTVEKLQSIDTKLNESDYQEVVNFTVPILSRKRLHELRNKIALQVAEYQANEFLSQRDTSLLALNALHYLWQSWGNQNPELRKSILPNMLVDDPKETLYLQPPQFGAEQLKGEPRIEDMNGLEDDINMLIQTKQFNTLDRTQRHKLKWLLRPLEPPHIRALRNVIVELEKLLSEDRLDISQIIRLIDLDREYREKFKEWLERIPVFGVRIDPRFYTKDAIAEAVARHAEWKRLQKARVEPGTTAQGHMKYNLYHGVDTILRTYVDERFEKDPKGTEIFLNSMPMSLRFMKLSISRPIERPLNIRECLTQAYNKQWFIIWYMNWHMSLDPSKVLQYRSLIPKMHKRRPVEYQNLAEIRGARRAAVETALNFLAGNQEQYRPSQFREVILASMPQPAISEVRMCMELEPWERKPELDPLHFTKVMRAYRLWKDRQYSGATETVIVKNAGTLSAPRNFAGPYSLIDQSEAVSILSQKLSLLIAQWTQLLEAQQRAPRPLLQHLLTLIAWKTETNDRLANEPSENAGISKEALENLKELTEPSWPATVPPPLAMVPEFTQQSTSGKNWVTFNTDLKKIFDSLPYWNPAPETDIPPKRILSDQEASVLLLQRIYNKDQPSRSGMPIDIVVQSINDGVDRDPGRQQHLWRLEEAMSHMKKLHSLHQIHFVVTANTAHVSRIPLDGHPENKYVTSLDKIKDIPGGAKEVPPGSGKFKIRYGPRSSLRVPPVLRPDKYQLYQRTAATLGSNIRKLASSLKEDRSRQVYSDEQKQFLSQTYKAMGKIVNQDSPSHTKTATLQTIAYDLYKSGPELFREAGIEDAKKATRGQAAEVIQMQLIEEMNNNWESLFPKDANLWQFARARISTVSSRWWRIDDINRNPQSRHQQFFSMRRWPLECQSIATQEKIKSSGDSVQTKAEAQKMQQEELKKAKELANTETLQRRKPQLLEPRHYKGQSPLFPFGETPYQQAYQGWRIGQELGIEAPLKSKGALQITAKSWTGWASKPSESLEKGPIGIRALPKIPDSLVPESASLRENRDQVVGKFREKPDFPRQLEFYYSAEEVNQIKQGLIKPGQQKRMTERPYKVKKRNSKKSGHINWPHNDATKKQLKNKAADDPTARGKKMQTPQKQRPLADVTREPGIPDKDRIIDLTDPDNNPSESMDMDLESWPPDTRIVPKPQTPATGLFASHPSPGDREIIYPSLEATLTKLNLNSGSDNSGPGVDYGSDPAVDNSMGPRRRRQPPARTNVDYAESPLARKRHPRDDIYSPNSSKVQKTTPSTESWEFAD